MRTTIATATATTPRGTKEFNFFTGYQKPIHNEYDEDLEEEEEEEEEDEKFRTIGSKKQGLTSASTSTVKESTHNSSPATKSTTGSSKFSNRIQNDITRSEKKSEKRPNYYGRDDRATMEQVMDPRTRLMLFKLLSNGFFAEIDGCLSTGKEANVYYAKGEGGVGSEKEQREYAVKIFKTSILVFKDRDKYVSGEFRFRNGYCKSNPRKMVRTWAEKEMRNLKRMSAAGIPCPVPRLLKAHILVMDFLGTDGWCAPRLKDATLTDSECCESYIDICVIMRRMYLDCNLVHGDLSEYNILWHHGKTHVIDVSQSVEHTHPYARELLNKDIENIVEFYKNKKKISRYVLSCYELFQFIVTVDLPYRLAEYSQSIHQSSQSSEIHDVNIEGNNHDSNSNNSCISSTSAISGSDPVTIMATNVITNQQQ